MKRLMASASNIKMFHQVSLGVLMSAASPKVQNEPSPEDTKKRREKRKELIERIEKKRHSKVITYVTSDRIGLNWLIMPDVVPIIHDHITALSEEERKKLDLLIYSRGGASDVPWTVVSMFRQYAEKGLFGVLIPFRAHSAATEIALGADEIVMTKKAELGPIDITIGEGWYNPIDKDNKKLPLRVEDVTGFFSLLDKAGCTSSEEKMRGFECLANQVHPLALGNVSRLLDETKLVALALLKTRAEPFPDAVNSEIVKKISSEVYSHEHAINRVEARNYIGLKQVVDAEDYDIANELWQLYEQYKALFDFENPFRAQEEILLSAETDKPYKNLNLACVESLNRCNLYRMDLLLRKIPQIPPQVMLQVGPVMPPPMDLTSILQKVAPQDVQAIQNLITLNQQQSINEGIVKATEKAREEFVRSQPPKLQTIQHNVRWEESCE
jgi:hypothetical protein